MSYHVFNVATNDINELKNVVITSKKYEKLSVFYPEYKVGDITKRLMFTTNILKEDEIKVYDDSKFANKDNRTPKLKIIIPLNETMKKIISIAEMMYGPNKKMNNYMTKKDIDDKEYIRFNFSYNENVFNKLLINKNGKRQILKNISIDKIKRIVKSNNILINFSYKVTTGTHTTSVENITLSGITIEVNHTEDIENIIHNKPLKGVTMIETSIEPSKTLKYKSDITDSNNKIMEVLGFS